MLISLKRTYLSALMFLAIGSIPVAAHAFVQQSSDFIVIGEEEIIDDNVFFIGDRVDIAGTIKGDLIVVASVLNIKGTVEGDVLAVGGDITIEGPVKGDIRIISRTATIDSIVGGNVMSLAEKLVFGSGAEIGHSITAATGNFEDNGAVVKHITIAAGTVAINGPVGGNLNASIGLEGGLVLLPNARIGGDINYNAPTDLKRAPGAEVAGVIKKIDAFGSFEIDFPFIELFLLFKFLSFLSIMLIGLLVIHLFPKASNSLADSMLVESFKLTLLGFAYFFLIPLVLAMLLFTIIGIPLALLLFVLYFIFMYFAKLAVALAIGKYVVTKSSKNEVGLFFSLFSGILLIYIVTSIPFVGWVVSALIIWWGLAGIFQWCYTQYRSSR